MSGAFFPSIFLNGSESFVYQECCCNEALKVFVVKKRKDKVRNENVLNKCGLKTNIDDKLEIY